MNYAIGALALSLVGCGFIPGKNIGEDPGDTASIAACPELSLVADTVSSARLDTVLDEFEAASNVQWSVRAACNDGSEHTVTLSWSPVARGDIAVSVLANSGWDATGVGDSICLAGSALASGSLGPADPYLFDGDFFVFLRYGEGGLAGFELRAMPVGPERVVTWRQSVGAPAEVEFKAPGTNNVWCVGEPQVVVP